MNHAVVVPTDWRLFWAGVATGAIGTLLALMLLASIKWGLA